MTAVLVREAKADDAQAINDICNPYVRESSCTFDEDTTPLEERAGRLAEHGPRYPVIVAEVDGEVVGWTALSAFHKRSPGRFTVQDSIYIRGDMKARGIGTALLTDLIVRARSLGYHSMMAGTEHDREESLAFHRRMGFVEVGRLKEAGRRFGRWLDVVYQQIIL